MPVFGNRAITGTFVARDNMSRSVATMRRNIASLGGPRFGTIGNLVSGFGAMSASTVALAAGIGFVTKGLGDAVRGAIDEEKSIGKLTTSLAANVAGWDGNTDAIEANIRANENLAFADDEQRDSLAQLLTRTHDVTKAQNLMRTAMDLARLKSISLGEASAIVGKVFSGQITAARRAGVAIDANATSTEALAQIQSAAAGQAERYADTTAGAMESMNIVLQDVSEDIGKELMPALRDFAFFVRDDVVPILKGAVEGIDNLSASIGFLVSGANLGAIDDGTRAIQRYAEEWDLTTDQVIEEIQSLPKSITESFDSIGDALVFLDNLRDQDLGGWGGYVRGVSSVVATLSGDIGGAAHGAFDPWVKESRRMGEKVISTVAHTLGPSMRDTIDDSKSMARDAIADYMFALKNPFAQKNYGEWLHDKIADAERRKLRALRNGNDAAVDEISAFIAWAQAQYEGLNLTVDVSVNRPSRRERLRRHRASGGPVEPGMTYIVGEHGPELLHMGRDQSGTVQSNRSVQGGAHGHDIYMDGRLVARALDRREGRQFALTAVSGD